MTNDAVQQRWDPTNYGSRTVTVSVRLRLWHSLRLLLGLTLWLPLWLTGALLNALLSATGVMLALLLLLRRVVRLEWLVCRFLWRRPLRRQVVIPASTFGLALATYGYGVAAVAGSADDAADPPAARDPYEAIEINENFERVN